MPIPAPVNAIGSTTPSWLDQLRPAGQDGVLAAGAAVIPLAIVLSDDRELAPGTRLAWGLLVLATCSPLALRRRFPLTAAAACAAASTAAALVAGRDATFLVVVLAIGLAAFDADGRRLFLTAGAIGWVCAFALLGGGAFDVTAVATYVGLGLAPIAFGYALRLQSQRTLDRARLDVVRSDVARWEERTRIARDVHDAVGHHLSAIHLQALGGRRALHAADPGADPGVDRALATIADLSHSSLRDIRLILERLGDDGAGGEGIADLQAMAARLGTDGMHVDITVGPALKAPPAVQACVYRVVQESLTNVVRHSGAAQASTRVEQVGDDLVVRVEDSGPRRPGQDRTAGAGRGVAGMRERVETLGGTLSAGPHGTGWLVRATLPLLTGSRQ